MTKNKNDNIILFPTNKIVEKSTTGPVKDDKFQKKLEQMMQKRKEKKLELITLEIKK